MTNAEIHDTYRSWALRARLDASNGGHDNHVIWCCEGAPNPNALELMDSWVGAVKADTSDAPLAEKVVAHKPEAATDRCIAVAGVPDEETCYALLGPFGGTRYGAGGPFAADVNKCRLKPLTRSDYFPIQFTSAHWSALESAFPSGVCDWSKPGVAQQPTIPWLTYAGGAGGQALGDAPVSVPL